jgi:hypothetical protein
MVKENVEQEKQNDFNNQESAVINTCENVQIFSFKSQVS